MNPIRVLVLVPLFVAAGCAGGEVPAPPTPEPGHDHAAHEHTEPTAPAADADAHAAGDGHEGHGVAAPLPGTYAAAVADLRGQVREARELAVAGKLSEIHPLTERMEESSASLPALATSVPGADPGSVAMGALAVKKAAGKLHVAADGGDVDETRKLLDELDTLVARLPTAP